MALIGTLVSFTAGTKIVSADVNSNFSAIRNAFNGSAVLNDTANTIAVAHTFTISQNLNAGFTTTTGTATFGAGAAFSAGMTVASGQAITASGVTITASTIATTGLATFGGNVTCAAALNVVGTITTNTGLNVPGTGSIGYGTVTTTIGLNMQTGVLLTGSTTQRGIFISPTADSGATTSVRAGEFQAVMQASAVTYAEAIGILIQTASKGAGATLTNNYGLFVNSQTAGATNFAIKTNTGRVSFGDNVTCAAALNVVGAITGNSITVSGTSTFSGLATFSIGIAVGAGQYVSSAGAWGMAASGVVAANVVATGILIATGANVIAQNVTLATNATTGFFYVATSPGTSTGVPVTNAGSVAICYDTTNNRLQIYNGGWKTVLLA